MSAPPNFILASASPRRLELLAQIGLVPSEIVSADLDETPLAKEIPRLTALRLAQAKAAKISAERPGALILAADTIVACGRRALPKAETENEALACLALLSGRTHIVYTAIVARRGDIIRQRDVATRVAFKRLSDADTAAYIASGEWRGKAGGYAIQGRAGAFVIKLNGSYSAVVGLPLYETQALLTSFA